jgi:lycopene cyclase domain-containing protein
MTLYAWLMLFSIVGPFALSFDKKVAFYKQWKALSIGILVNAVLFIVWDIWFTKKQIWGFNPAYTSSIKFWGLPIEELSFFIVVPYASVFIYACLKAYLKRGIQQQLVSWFNYIGMFMCLVAMVVFAHKTYTLVNTSIAFMLLAAHQFWLKKAYMTYFWIAYFVHLLPFVIINGVLTGAVTPNPIVWYSSDHIIGLRFVSIPIEDFIYALSCLLLPITIMEAILVRQKQIL